MQTRKGSITESLTNIAVGFWLSWVLNITTLPLLWDPKHKALSSTYIGIVFTVASLIRSYCLRRWFNSIKFGNKRATT